MCICIYTLLERNFRQNENYVFAYENYGNFITRKLQNHFRTYNLASNYFVIIILFLICIFSVGNTIFFNNRENCNISKRKTWIEDILKNRPNMACGKYKLTQKRRNNIFPVLNRSRVYSASFHIHIRRPNYKVSNFY